MEQLEHLWKHIAKYNQITESTSEGMPYMLVNVSALSLIYYRKRDKSAKLHSKLHSHSVLLLKIDRTQISSLAQADVSDNNDGYAYECCALGSV